MLGAVLLYAIPETLREIAKPAQLALFGEEWVAPEALRMLLFGLSLVVIMLFRPSGLWPAPKHGLRPARAGAARTEAAVEPRALAGTRADAPANAANAGTPATDPSSAAGPAEA